LRIAVFHHNICSVSWGEDFLDPKYLDILGKEGFDLCLHGHVHKPEHDVYDATQARVLPVIGAGSLAAPYQDRPPATPMGYNLIVAGRVSQGIWVHTRRSDEVKLAWKADYQWDGKPYFNARTPKTPQTIIPGPDNPVGPEDGFCSKMLKELEHCYKNEDTLRRLCFDVRVPYAQLAGGTTFARLQSLLESFREHEGLERLLTQCKDDYPNGRWPQLPTDLRACP
jgi:hypothetical protein